MYIISLRSLRHQRSEHLFNQREELYMQQLPRKYAEIQNHPGYVIFYTEFLISCGLHVDPTYMFTALTTQQAKQLGLL